MVIDEKITVYRARAQALKNVGNIHDRGEVLGGTMLSRRPEKDLETIVLSRWHDQSNVFGEQKSRQVAV
jgi:hypothetical protein